MEAEALPLVSILGLKEDVPPRIAPPAPAVSYSGSKFGITIHVVRNGARLRCSLASQARATHAAAHALTMCIMLSCCAGPEVAVHSSTWRCNTPPLCAYANVAGKCHMHGVDNVGTVPAAVTAYLAVHEFQPDLLISMGTAGGFRARGAAIGDVFLATGFANHDRRIPIPVGATCHAWLVMLGPLRAVLQETHAGHARCVRVRFFLYAAHGRALTSTACGGWTRCRRPTSGRQCT